MPNTKKPLPAEVPTETRPAALREGLVKRADRYIAGTGTISFKCIPSLVDQYVDSLAQIFKAYGRVYGKADLEKLKTGVAKHVEVGWKHSPYSRIEVEYTVDTPPKQGLSYKIRTQVTTMEQVYEEWVKSREPPYFGKYPDAKVLDVAATLGPPDQVSVIDIGGGTGRNALPLARLGHPTWVVEMSPVWITELHKAIKQENLPVHVVEGDGLDPSVALPTGMSMAILCEVLTHFRGPSQVQTVFRRMADVLRPGGVLLFSCFLPIEPYVPDALARQVAEMCWSTLFTRDEIARARKGLPFELMGEDRLLQYEHSRVPDDEWPPTKWFAHWATGHDVYRLASPPIELTWLAFRRTK